MTWMLIILIVYPVLLAVDILLGLDLTPLIALAIPLLSSITQPDPSITIAPLLLVVARSINYIYRTRSPGFHAARLLLEFSSLPLFFLLYGSAVVLLLGSNTLPGLDPWVSSVIFLTTFFTASISLYMTEPPVAWMGRLLEHDAGSIEDNLWRISLASSLLLAIQLYMEIHAYIIVYLVLLGLAVYYRRQPFHSRLLLVASLAYSLALTII